MGYIGEKRANQHRAHLFSGYDICKHKNAYQGGGKHLRLTTTFFESHVANAWG